MRKFTLVIMAALITGTVFSQSIPAGPNHKIAYVNPALLKPVKIPFNSSLRDAPMHSNANAAPQQPAGNIIFGQPRTVRDVTETIIGTTYYDLQTNEAINDRLSNNGDGTLSATWTMSPDWTSGFPNRGTGYNYFDGAAWGSQPTDRIEGTYRAGFTNVVVTGKGAELVVTHSSTSLNLLLTSRAAKGTGDWSEDATALASPAVSGNLWSKTAVSGDNVHVISVTTPSALGGALYHGMDGDLLYDRSTDGGATWDITNATFPDLDSAHYIGVSADDYQVDARGNTVAVVEGDINSDVLLFKSTDNGETWTKTIVFKHPFPFFTDDTLTDVGHDGHIDSIEVCDGKLGLLIDDNDMVHVWWGDAYILNDVAGDGLLSYYPGFNGIMYWNESFGDVPPVAITGALDLDGNGQLDLPVNSQGQLAIGNYGFSSLATMPNAGIDANGNIYLAYSAAVENTTDAVGEAVRHTYAIVSTDHGTSWGEFVIDVVNDNTQEGVYGAIARNVDDKVHIIYQKDYCAGVSGLFGTNDPDPCNDGNINQIAYVEFPVSDLGVAIGIPTIKGPSSDINVFPNPSSGAFTLMMKGITNSNVDVKVSNVLGQTMKQLNNQSLTDSKLPIDLSDLANGNYMLNVIAGSKIYTTMIRISKD